MQSLLYTQIIKKLLFSFTQYKERAQILDTKKVKNNNFYKNKKVTKIDDTDVNKILVSKKEPYGTKNFGYNHNDNDAIMHKGSTNDWLCWKIWRQYNNVFQDYW